MRRAPTLVILTLVAVVASGYSAAVAAQSDAGARVIDVAEVDERTRDLTIDSPSVGTQRVRLILPAHFDDEPEATWPVLYLLHGQGGNSTNWTVDTSIATELSADLDVLVVMPDGGAGWYSDWWNFGDGGEPAWETFHLTELREIMESDWRAGDARAIAGVSMGGFGAMSYAARNPGMFRAAASYSGVVDPLGSDFGDDFALWGDKVEQLDVWEAHDPVTLAPALEGTELYVWYGDGTDEEGGPVVDGLESWLVGHNEAFVGRLAELGIPAIVESGPGTHSWDFWDGAFERSLPMLLAALEQ